MLTQAELKKMLTYNPETGDFTWVTAPAQSVKVGEIAGSKDTYGYHKIALQRKTYKAHRLAWLYMYGEFPSSPIDHINGVRHDNRIENLRAVTAQQNQQNQKRFKHNTSGVTGVHWHAKAAKWHARIFAGGKRIHLGAFDSLPLAEAARKAAEAKYNFHTNHGRG